jgi:hypothetical protein
MRCGPVRHQVSAKSQAAESGIHHRARERHTGFRLPEAIAIAERPSMPAIYAVLDEDEARNAATAAISGASAVRPIGIWLCDR